MGYACPVCGTPQMDAGHLANHLAFTALLGDDPHETWLDEHAPGWAEAGEEALAPRVVEHAPEREFPQVFEDTVGTSDHEDPDERSGALFARDRDREFAPAGRAPDPAVERALAAARDLTERRRAGTDPTSGEDGPGGEANGTDAGDAEERAADRGEEPDAVDDADGNE